MALSYGLKIATPGSDVATQPVKDLAFTSQYPSLKIIKSGDISITTDGAGNGTVSVDHNLGFAPSYLSFRKATAQWTTLDASSHPNAYLPDIGIRNQWTDNYQFFLNMYTDATKVYVQAKDAQASTTYNLHYILFADLAQDYTGQDISVSGNVGFKVSREGIDVTEAKQYQLAYSSRYKALQYYDVNFSTYTLTLPIMFASPIDTEVEEGTYVDINHGLGYPPMYLSFFKSNYTDTTTYVSIPYQGLNPLDAVAYSVASFCDSTKIRLSFWRSSTFLYNSFPYPNYDYQESITIKVYIFTEDLSKSFNAF